MKTFSQLKKLLLIINPVSGRRTSLRFLPDIIRIFSEGDYAVTVFPTGKSGDATQFAQLYGNEFDLIVCIGGDGTLNEVVNGAAGHANAAVTHFPGGSGNDFIKIFSDPAAFRSLPRLLDAEEATFDLIR